MTEAMHYHTHTNLSAFIKKKSNIKTVKCKITPITYIPCRTWCIYYHSNCPHCPLLRVVFLKFGIHLKDWSNGSPAGAKHRNLQSGNVKMLVCVNTLNRCAVYEKGGGRWLGQVWGCKRVLQWRTAAQPGRTSSLHHRRRSGWLLSCM